MILLVVFTMLLASCRQDEQSPQVGSPYPTTSGSEHPGASHRTIGTSETSNSPYTDDALSGEQALLEYSRARGVRSWEHLLQQTRQAAEKEPNYTYLWYLYAYAARLAGQETLEAQALERAGEFIEGRYRYFFLRPPNEVAALLRCHRIHACLREEHLYVPPFLWRNGLEKPDTELRCLGMSIRARICPPDYSLFERITLRSRGADRVGLWNPDAPETSVAELARIIGLQPGMDVADLGAGVGYFTLPFARVVGPSGRVYAVDIDPYAKNLIGFLARFHHLENISTLLSKPDDITIHGSSLDMVFICDTLKTIIREDASPSAPVYRLLASIRRSLKPEGVLVISEKQDSEDLPDRIPMEQLARVVIRAGFPLEQTFEEFFPLRYLARFRRSGD